MNKNKIIKIEIEVKLPKKADKDYELALLLQRIGNQIEEGYTSGYEMNYSWDIKEENDN